MALDTNKVALPSYIPYGFGMQQDTVPASDVPLVLMKPESADLIKQKADAKLSDPDDAVSRGYFDDSVWGKASQKALEDYLKQWGYQ